MPFALTPTISFKLSTVSARHVQKSIKIWMVANMDRGGHVLMCEVDSVHVCVLRWVSEMVFSAADLVTIVGVRAKGHNSALDRDIGPKF